jgi:sulfur-oxidizing protein SoxY
MTAPWHAITVDGILTGNESLVTRTLAIFSTTVVTYSKGWTCAMTTNMRILILSRRTFMVSAAAGVCVPTFLAKAEAPAQSVMERSSQFDEAFKALLAGATPVEGKITLELPEIAENGNFVPVTITVDSPMTAEDHVKAVHILSTGNPVARVATFHLSPINAVARVQSRMRLAKTQDVIALAELSNGSLAIATTLVKVTIGGCAS